MHLQEGGGNINRDCNGGWDGIMRPGPDTCLDPAPPTFNMGDDDT